jgi:hypothetical protein
VRDVRSALASTTADKPALLLINRRGAHLFVTLN